MTQVVKDNRKFIKTFPDGIDKFLNVNIEIIQNGKLSKQLGLDK